MEYQLGPRHAFGVAKPDQYQIFSAIDFPSKYNKTFINTIIPMQKKLNPLNGKAGMDLSILLLFLPSEPQTAYKKPPNGDFNSIF